MLDSEIVKANLCTDAHIWEGMYELADESIMVCRDSGRGPCAGRVIYQIYATVQDYEDADS